jgi:hypothetical protein
LSIGMFYKIVVEGELSERFSEAFPGMSMKAESGQTIIMGEIVDQSHLHGILDRISSMGLPLVSVQTLPQYVPGRDDAATVNPSKNRET